MTLRNVLEENCWVFARIVDEELTKVGTACRQQQFMGFESLVFGGKSHISEVIVFP